MRLSKTEYGCLLALSASSRSEDPTTKVGCVIENGDHKIISTGYNGLKNGFDFFDIQNIPREEKLKYFIHAETNALSQINKGEGTTLYCTHSPCQYCAQNIIAHGIERVIYIKLYQRCDTFQTIFEKFNVEHRELTNTEKKNIKSYLQDLKRSFF